LAITAARQQWFAEARTNPDVTVRHQALELWAQQPSQDLDPLTYALVDEDESVRTRAQEIYEQQLAREATTAQPAAPGDADDARHLHHPE
jgi:hypothetical protein